MLEHVSNTYLSSTSSTSGSILISSSELKAIYILINEGNKIYNRPLLVIQ